MGCFCTAFYGDKIGIGAEKGVQCVVYGFSHGSSIKDNLSGQEVRRTSIFFTFQKEIRFGQNVTRLF